MEEIDIQPLIISALFGIIAVVRPDDWSFIAILFSGFLAWLGMVGPLVLPPEKLWSAERG